MKKIFSVLLATALWMVATLAGAASPAGDYVEAEGVCYPEKGISMNAMRRIAIMDAYRYLAEQVGELYVASNSTVKNLRELDEEINTKVEVTIRGAKIVSALRKPDGSFHAKVCLSMYGNSHSIAAAVLKENVMVDDFPKPKFTNIHSETHYTGLIVDCRELNLPQAITPMIKSVDGLEIYAYKNIGYQAAVDKGIVEYSNGLASTRAGDSPLIVKAIGISDKCDVVVSNEDADRILAANQADNFLHTCSVALAR